MGQIMVKLKIFKLLQFFMRNKKYTLYPKNILCNKIILRNLENVFSFKEVFLCIP